MLCKAAASENASDLLELNLVLACVRCSLVTAALPSRRLSMASELVS